MSPEVWLRALIDRHTSAYSRPEFLKAVRALSSRYVEDRARLGTRSPLDSAGKRAAFAGFYAPLHFLAVRAIVAALPAAPGLSRLLDLGCGTGVAGIAWATTVGVPAAITGIDHSAWALDEMRWNCHGLGLPCRTQRGSFVDALERDFAPGRRAPLDTTGIVCAWSVNELTSDERNRVRASLFAAHARGASVLIIEPMATSAVPWWDTWRAPVLAAGGRADEWRFEPDLPAELAELDEAAGFRRDHLTARSFWLGPRVP
jgi:SAM-dependent methyltransferase